ncbi:hypothetical protein EFT36_08465 [Raoultella ornithinolytica]|nr:hypothetical protein EFT36_08465 [Raoultella ornithinolytica]
MSNNHVNFEMTGSPLGQEVRKRKTPQEKSVIIQQTIEPGRNHFRTYLTQYINMLRQRRKLIAVTNIDREH